MTSISFEGKTYLLNANETILDGLLRHECDIRYGCRSGVCQGCVLALEDESHSSGLFQTGLSAEQKMAGHILACQSKPDSPVNLRRVDQATVLHRAKVIEKTWLNATVIGLKLQVNISYRAGQYVTLWRDKNCARSYSIASATVIGNHTDNVIECHIRHYSGGQFSHWLAQEVSEGQILDLQGPLGSCIYAVDQERPLLMVAKGTGLAPIYGVLQDAIRAGHSGPIDIVVSARDSQQLYYVEQLRQLADQSDNVRLHFIVKESLAEEGLAENDLLASEATNGSEFDSNIVQGSVYDYCGERFTALEPFKIYLCGAEAFVTKLRKQFFMAGASLNDISTDTFFSFQQ